MIFTGGRIAAVGVGSEVDRILLVSGLYRIMDKYDSVETAIRKLNTRTGEE